MVAERGGFGDRAGAMSKWGRNHVAIDVDATLGNVVSNITLDSKQGRKAVRRALRKWARWANRQTLRAASLALELPQKVLKSRVYSDYDFAAWQASLWVGTSSMPAHLLGTPKQEEQYRGTFVRDYYFEHAFVASIYGGGKRVWRRKFIGIGSTMFGAQEPGLRGRFPVELQVIELRDEMSKALLSIEKRARPRLKKLFLQELNYALFVENDPAKRRAVPA